MLRETLEQRKDIKYKSKLYHIQIYCQRETSVICKQCGFFLAPFSAFSHYLNIDIPQYRFGNHFLVTDHYNFQYLQVEHDDEIFNTQEPFLLLYLKPVHCDYCHQPIGLYFQTVNTLDTQWLLDRMILNMEKLRLGDNRQASMQRAIDSLFGLLTQSQIQKEQNKICFKLEKVKAEARERKVRFIQKELELQRLLLSSTNPIFAENRKKGELARSILASLRFFDRRTQRMERQCRKLMEKSDALKFKIMQKFSTIQDFKRKMMMLKNSKGICSNVG